MRELSQLRRFYCENFNLFARTAKLRPRQNPVTDKRTDGRTDGQMDGQTDDGKVIPKCHLCLQQVTQK